MLEPPKPGTIIHYSYLWHADQEAGLQSPSRPHPAVVMALAIRTAASTTDVLVLPITHAPPYHPNDAIEIPEDVRRAAGLDAFPQWVVVSESNVFRWPGPDLRPLPGRDPQTYVYGVMPREFIRTIALAFKTRNRGSATSAKEVQRP